MTLGDGEKKKDKTRQGETDMVSGKERKIKKEARKRQIVQQNRNTNRGKDKMIKKLEQSSFPKGFVGEIPFNPSKIHYLEQRNNSASGDVMLYAQQQTFNFRKSGCDMFNV